MVRSSYLVQVNELPFIFYLNIIKFLCKLKRTSKSDRKQHSGLSQIIEFIKSMRFM